MRLSEKNGEIRGEPGNRVLVFDCPCALNGQDSEQDETDGQVLTSA